MKKKTMIASISGCGMINGFNDIKTITKQVVISTPTSARLIPITADEKCIDEIQKALDELEQLRKDIAELEQELKEEELK